MVGLADLCSAAGIAFAAAGPANPAGGGPAGGMAGGQPAGGIAEEPGGPLIGGI